MSSGFNPDVEAQMRAMGLSTGANRSETPFTKNDPRSKQGGGADMGNTGFQLDKSIMKVFITNWPSQYGQQQGQVDSTGKLRNQWSEPGASNAPSQTPNYIPNYTRPAPIMPAIPTVPAGPSVPTILASNAEIAKATNAMSTFSSNFGALPGPPDITGDPAFKMLLRQADTTPTIVPDVEKEINTPQRATTKEKDDNGIKMLDALTQIVTLMKESSRKEDIPERTAKGTPAEETAKALENPTQKGTEATGAAATKGAEEIAGAAPKPELAQPKAEPGAGTDAFSLALDKFLGAIGGAGDTIGAAIAAKLGEVNLKATLAPDSKVTAVLDDNAIGAMANRLEAKQGFVTKNYFEDTMKEATAGLKEVKDSIEQIKGNFDPAKMKELTDQLGSIEQKANTVSEQLAKAKESVTDIPGLEQIKSDTAKAKSAAEEAKNIAQRAMDQASNAARSAAEAQRAGDKAQDTAEKTERAYGGQYRTDIPSVTDA